LELSVPGEKDKQRINGHLASGIPATATVDVKIGGQYDRFFWSAAVLNLFNASYFDYAIASAFTPGYFTAYPQPGRTFMLRGGATF
jgi:iron complex outermembrane receptor protein